MHDKFKIWVSFVFYVFYIKSPKNNVLNQRGSWVVLDGYKEADGWVDLLPSSLVGIFASSKVLYFPIRNWRGEGALL